MKKFILLLILFVGWNVFAQEKMNAYKYAVVPSQFDFQKEPNQYGINLLLKYKFQQLGFETFMDTDDLPFELKKNTCLYVTPNMITDNGMFITRVRVEVKNCLNQELFMTEEGNSNEKSYKTSYTVALREALLSFKEYQLDYQPIHEEVVDEVNGEEVDVVIEKENPQEDESTEVLLKKKGAKGFLYDGDQILFDKTNQLFYAEIKVISTNVLLGKISKTSKKGIYHVFLDSKNGVGYYDETGNFIVEFLNEDGTVILHRLQLLN